MRGTPRVTIGGGEGAARLTGLNQEDEVTLEPRERFTEKGKPQYQTLLRGQTAHRETSPKGG